MKLEQEGARAHLRIAGVPGGAVQVTGEVWFGPHHHRWVDELGTVGVGDDVTLEPVVPVEAMLHPLAATYVASLTLVVTVGGTAYYPANAYVAWPDGVDQPGVIWTEEALEVLAPHGVLDPSLREGLPEGTLLLPPIYGRFAEPGPGDTGGEVSR